MNTCAFLKKAALYRGQQPAIVYGDESVTYSEFYRRALAIGGNLLQLGLKPGDRVAFCLANSPRILEVIYGCFAAGMITVPINARLHPREIAYIVNDSGAKVLVHGPEYEEGIASVAGECPGLQYRFQAGDKDFLQYAQLLDDTHRLEDIANSRSEDPTWLFYTSGTTGKPKGALWTHRTIRVVIMNYLADLYNIQPGENVLHCAPLSHGSGIIALPAIARGATNIIFDRESFVPEALFALVEKTRTSHIAFMAPTQIIKCLEDYQEGKYDLSSLQGICYGGAPIHVEHLKAAIRTFGPIFIQLFGQGEAPITVTGMSAKQHQVFLETDDPRLGSAGTIRTDVEACCADEEGNLLPPGEMGEVVVRGDIVMEGYWNKPEATAETIRNGWLFTGDIGKFDEQGYLFLLDRSKDVIISGGNNVYPREVEEVIVQHPAVAEVVVIGIPDSYWGEAVHAVVILKPGATCTDQEIIAFCGQHLAGYKKPKAVDFVDEFPVSGYGKILKRELRERYWGNDSGRIVGGAKTSPTT